MSAKARLLGVALALAATPALARHAPPPPPWPSAPRAQLHLRCLDDEARIDDAILVDVADDQGRVHVPRALLPAIHANTIDDWRRISPVKVEDRQIAGRFPIGALNTASIAVDRMTGRINIAGLGFEFKGDCRPYTPDADRKF